MSHSLKNYAKVSDYYKGEKFNPVPIHIEKEQGWHDHVEKRQNLYEHHLMLPLRLFKDANVIEFGCNSGENALYLASLGAQLTLVEPNEQVLPRLSHLFREFNLESRIKALLNTDIEGFASLEKFDVVIAEGFLSMLDNGEESFGKICKYLKEDGIGIISFDDHYGSLLEFMRGLILKLACQLKGLPFEEWRGKESLNIARELYEEDFRKINTSRPFESWWQDALVNPFYNSVYSWKFPRVVSLLEKAECGFYSSSPKWETIDHYFWYKNALTLEERHQRLLISWYENFSFFLLGNNARKDELCPADEKLVQAVSRLCIQIYESKTAKDLSRRTIVYPQELDQYLGRSGNEHLRGINNDLKRICHVVKDCSFEELSRAYQQSQYFRNSWGAACSYICFKKMKGRDQ